jgi:hypothetical protein
LAILRQRAAAAKSISRVHCTLAIAAKASHSSAITIQFWRLSIFHLQTNGIDAGPEPNQGLKSNTTIFYANAWSCSACARKNASASVVRSPALNVFLKLGWLVGVPRDVINGFRW